MKINIYLIRHGKTKENEEKRYVGITDTPLSDTGREKIAKNKENGICFFYKKHGFINFDVCVFSVFDIVDS